MYKSTYLPLVYRGHHSEIGENHDYFPSRSSVNDRLGRVEPGKHLANLQINQPAGKTILQELAGESLDVVMENLVATSDIVDPVAQTGYQIALILIRNKAVKMIKQYLLK